MISLYLDGCTNQNQKTRGSKEPLSTMAFKVSESITDDGILQFHPCLFLPHPERVLQKYPIDTSVCDDDPPSLNYHPHFDSPANHISAGRPSDTCENLLRGSNDGVGAGQVAEPCPPNTVLYVMAYGCYPEGPIDKLSHIPANHADQGLSFDEVRGIANMMLVRISHWLFRGYSIHPLLVLSYMGEKYGRINQASFDGQNLFSRYPQLWSFQDDDVAPVEIFMRYQKIVLSLFRGSLRQPRQLRHPRVFQQM
ncbi:hypothetical protein N7475_009971 [Penicillium sp. IBT 31633x]|nr:hypothetical protein N7475_009971 [Penicillium sp. IBT 31633x]